jgi:mono/diheme cytochrome c family protein
VYLTAGALGIGAVTLGIAALGVIGWLTFLVNQTRVRRRREAAPQNLSPFLTDDDLETKRLNKVLVSALIATAVMAIVMPVYYLNETARQESAVEKFEEIAVHRGEEWYHEFGCGDCHGADGAGGGASFIEPRSGLSTAWAAPSIDDVLYRYDEEEVRYWLVFGRQGSPMPAWGVEGGGPMNEQQIDELIAYLEHIQISQAEAVAAVDGKVERELARLTGADDSLAATRQSVEDDIAALAAAPVQYQAAAAYPDRLIEILAGPTSCTTETAAVVGQPCASEAADADRDGVSDVAEVTLKTFIREVLTTAPASDATVQLAKVEFDPNSGFSTANGSTAVPDFDQVPDIVAEIDNITRSLRLTVEGRETLLSISLTGLEFVKEAAEAQRYAIDFDAIAAAEFDGDIEAAQRGAALYNAYCARCHTAGYSAGIAFTQEVGSGALGPSLRDNRSAIQFPDPAEHLDFIIKGSAAGQLYGLNGIGRGWMPGFGTVLTEADLTLIVKFERALR